MGQSGIIPWTGSSRAVFEGKEQSRGRRRTRKGGGGVIICQVANCREEHACDRMPYKEPFIHCRRPGERHDRDELILGWRLKPDGRILGPIAHS